MEDEIADLLEGFEKSQEAGGLGGERKEEPPKKQLSEAQTKALVAELNQQQREELCRVLKAQSDGEKDLRLSPELARVLHRFQRRAGLGPGGGYGETGDETWPMYLGIVLFIVITIVFIVIYFQERAASDLEERESEEDTYWFMRDFG
eukprot:TRINITY_DN104303_c0_g1_i1.p2 TRINITY_DN104303_c0_g1~~TRINITY_DN104303_c0_g1_i1.p2  ORF type:complete len:148 (+),score=51.38 TRINITY_DN104303_c0_g1_i1:97-540(+)